MDFEELLLMLSEGGVKFIVTGGVACAFNGFVRATDDLDILIDASEKNISRMLELLKGWGKGYAKELEITDFPVSSGAIRLIEDFPLDIFTMLNEKTYEDLFPESNISDQGIHYLKRAALIEIKKKSYREKDKIDVLALEKIENTTSTDN
ncbi:MAG: hypothetical protein PVG39_17825 [Desulfobacteraceae bacterium]|jgi:hypothetical protein